MTKPGFYYSDGPYLRVMQGLVRALSQPEALVKLLGKPQTGKSLLCEKLAYFMRHKDFRVVYVHFAVESPEALRTLLARELDLPAASNFSRMIEEIPAAPNGNPIILIFDNAHLLTEDTLQEIYRIAQVQCGATRVLNVVLCGEPQLEQLLLGATALRSLRMQVSRTLVLEPMSQEEFLHFTSTYLVKAGLTGLQLDSAAQRFLFKCCQGYPKQALELSQLLVASRQQSVELDAIGKSELEALVRKAQAPGDEYLLLATQSNVKRRWLIVGALVVILVIAGSVWRY